jgi:hypothetical protein
MLPLLMQKMLLYFQKLIMKAWKRLFICLKALLMPQGYLKASRIMKTGFGRKETLLRNENNFSGTGMGRLFVLAANRQIHIKKG